MSSRLLMIEDDGRLARMVGEYLVESGFAGQEWRVRAAAVHARSRTYAH